MSDWTSLVPAGLVHRYDLHNFNHAVEIMTQAYPAEFRELVMALDLLQISTDDILQSGGNESPIPKRLSALLRPQDWQEVRITADLLVKVHRRNPTSVSQVTIPDFVDGHNIDYVKNRVAVDLEWNSKDQTFDRDLYAFRTFYECGIIACGMIITRSEKLNPVFAHLGVMHKFGASTTWMGKLLPRISSGRHGGCPLLVVGITPQVIADLPEEMKQNGV